MSEHGLIDSPQNPLIKSLQGLTRAKERAESGKILIESLHPVQEALRANLPLEYVFVREDVADKISNALHIAHVTVVSERVMAKLATTQSPPEVLAVAKRPVIQTSYPPEATCVLGLYQLQDPGNVGTLIRSALAFDVTHVAFIGHNGVEPFHPKVIRATAGQLFHINVITLEAMTDIASDVSVIAMDAQGQTKIDALTWPSGKSLILLGQEGEGLPAELPVQTAVVSLPMANGVESLNVAVAGSLVLAHRYWQCAR
jgi:TrmH family RNA methyltransferase